MNRALRISLWVALLIGMEAPAQGASYPAILPERSETPSWLRDRGAGVSTSLFGTYVRHGELLVYPFYEYTWNKDQEYQPSEIGFPGEQDYRGKSAEHEVLIFLAYGLSENVALELESAVHVAATQHKAPDDTSSVPPKLTESGFGDTQAELRWRWWRESSRRPEFWSYFEVAFPLQRGRALIGTQDWELVQGFAITRGFRWGTLTARASAIFTTEENSFALGEYALEYLKRVGRHGRVFLAIEGEEDEAAVIGEAQWELAPRALLKLNTGFGVTSKAPDLAPEIGILFSF